MVKEEPPEDNNKCQEEPPTSCRSFDEIKAKTNNKYNLLKDKLNRKKMGRAQVDKSKLPKCPYCLSKEHVLRHGEDVYHRHKRFACTNCETTWTDYSIPTDRQLQQQNNEGDAGETTSANKNTNKQQAIEQPVIEQPAMVFTDFNMLGSMINNSIDGICIMNNEGRFITANNIFLQTIGWNKEEVVGQCFTKVCPHNRKETAKLEWKKVQQGHHFNESMTVSQDGTVKKLSVFHQKILVNNQPYTIVMVKEAIMSTQKMKMTPIDYIYQTQ